MKAVVFNQQGPPSVFEYVDVAEPRAAAGEVVIRVAATSVNRVDTLVRSGYPGLVVHMPHIAGGDASGTIAEIGEGVDDFKIGDRVVAWPLIACGTCDTCLHGKANICINWQFIGMHRNGTYAEYVCVPAKSVLHLPDSVSFDDAATLPTAGIVAYHGLANIAAIQQGETFFIWGGASGVGTFAVQLAKLRGATVFATAGSKEKMEVVKNCGADYVFNHHEDDVQKQVIEITHGLGVDALIDYVGPQTFPKSFAMTKKGGRIMLCGILTGREATLSLHLTYLHHKSILGIYLGTKTDLGELLELVAQKKITPKIFDVLPLHKAAEAHQMMQECKHYGKILLRP